ncbi:MAG: glycosyltransferase family 4 protein [Dysgonomonas sp.]
MNNKLKTVIVIDDYAFINGGAASVAIRTACYLANNIDLDVYYFSTVGPVTTDLKEAKLKEIVCLNQDDILSNSNKYRAFIQGIWNKKSKKALTTFLNRFDNKSTIIHIHTWTKALSSSVFEAIEALGFQVVVTLHDYFISCPNGGYFNYQKSEICDLKPMSFRCLSCNCDSRHYYFKLWRVIRQFIQNKNVIGKSNISYIFISKFSKMQMEKRSFIPNRSVLIDNPVDFNGRYKINAFENNVFLYLGRLSEEKGIRLFCEIVDSLGLKAVVIGDGPLKLEMEKKYGKKILFTGWLSREEIKPYFEKTRMLIFASLLYETLGLTVLEAMAYGIPCLVPDISAASDLIDDGVNGFIYKSGNKESLINAINKSQDNNWVKLLSNNSYNSFQESRYSMTVHVSNLISTYNSILSNKI